MLDLTPRFSHTAWPFAAFGREGVCHFSTWPSAEREERKDRCPLAQRRQLFLWRNTVGRARLSDRHGWRCSGLDSPTFMDHPMFGWRVQRPPRDKTPIQAGGIGVVSSSSSREPCGSSEQSPPVPQGKKNPWFSITSRRFGQRTFLPRARRHMLTPPSGRCRVPSTSSRCRTRRAPPAARGPDGFLSRGAVG